MDRLSELIAVSVLHKAGARNIFTQSRNAGIGRHADTLAFFSFAGVNRVWRIRGDAFKQNFERDVERELGSEIKQKVA